MHVIATAGHVDHGKSTLVRALTGMEPDRFAEERRRGMTIDLGYAWTTVPTVPTVPAGAGTVPAEIAFVDVPGHQRFIANMLTGIGPAPAVLFVVAADEGWARQSSEHLAAVDALDVRHGLLAVTRSDLADPSSALTDARARVARSSLGAVEAVVVSGTTGAGLTELRAALGRLVSGLPVPDPAARVRLWLDRSFSIRGSGTVVTATLGAGTIGIDDELELRGRRVTVRALQVAGAPQDRVAAPARVAVNLRGVSSSAVSRGDVLITPGAWHWTDTVDASLALRDRMPAELVLHVGTTAVPTRVRMLGANTARLTMPQPLPVQVGDRGVLRDPGRQSVAAGMRVLDAEPPRLARRGAAAARAAALAGGAPDLGAEVARRGAVARDHLVRLGVEVTARAGVEIVDDWLVDPGTWRGWLGAIPGVLDEWAERHPLEPAPPSAALRRELALPPDPQLLDAVLAGAGLQIVDGRVVCPGSTGQLDRLPAAVHTLVARLRVDNFAAPDRDELRDLSIGHRELAAAARAGVLLTLADHIVLLPSTPATALHVLRALDQPFTTSEARQALGTSRRVVIPLLEHLDRIGATQRVNGTQRRLT